jgi:hypothetical protein
MSETHKLTDGDLTRIDDRFIQKSSVSKVMTAIITICFTIGGATLVKNCSDTQLINAELVNNNKKIEKLSIKIDKLDNNVDRIIRLMARK